MGDYYLSTLIFRHAMFKKNPIVPIGFLIHSRRFREDHLNFLKAIRQSISLLASRRIVIVTDREFNFSEIFPLGCHVFCWNHLEQDLHYYLKNTANCSATNISFFAHAFKGLMIETTETKFDQAWSVLKETKEFQSHDLVRNYFENKLLPAFKAHSGF